MDNQQEKQEQGQKQYVEQPGSVKHPIRINLDDLENIKCEECEGIYFDTIWMLKKVPAILSQTGAESIYPVSVFRCLECLKVTRILHHKP